MKCQLRAREARRNFWTLSSLLISITANFNVGSANGAAVVADTTQPLSLVNGKDEGDEVGAEQLASSTVEEEPPKTKPIEKASTEPEKLEKEETDESTNDEDSKKARESKDVEMEEERSGTENWKKIAWPIGVPWESDEPTSMEEKKVPEKKEKETKVTFLYILCFSLFSVLLLSAVRDAECIARTLLWELLN